MKLYNVSLPKLFRKAYRVVIKNNTNEKANNRILTFDINTE